MPSHPSILPPSHPYSHLRSSSNPAQSPSSTMQVVSQPPLQWKHAYPYPTASPECADCTTECTEPMCSTSNQLTPQCTDQCVVIACSDPEHNNCFESHTNCDFVCDSEDCNGFEALLQCCDGSHPCHLDQTQPPNFSQQSYPQQQTGESDGWNASFPGANRECDHTEQPDRIPPPPSLTTFAPVTTSTNTTTPSLSSAANNNSHRYSPSITTYQPPPSGDPYAPVPSQYSSIVQPQPYSPRNYEYHTSECPLRKKTSSSSSPQPLLSCMWGNCKAIFTSLSDLVGHVNLAHLRSPTNSDTPTSTPSEILAQILQTDDTARLPCLWGDCTEHLQLQLLAGTSGSSAEDIMLSNLASHLFQDHLGLHQFKSGIQNNHLDGDHMYTEMATTQQETQGRVGQDPQYKSAGFIVPSGSATEDSVPVHNPQADTTDPQTLVQRAKAQLTSSPLTATSTISSPATSVVEVAFGEGHVCRWEGCGMSFETCNDLMTHMSAAHVGSGKPQYDCLWEGCTRNGNKGFSSKQKICRHLQSHTGYRPFQCPECLQNFSEAATLQQHIRRHTQEKPYKCDFPGCGKSFAITGALTIHKRIHNGQKPFKCSYCGRGFAESSNLSKHLRTHTGERPYVCAEPGCGKAFARPDQLTRHTAVHRKKASAAITASEV